MPDMTPRRRAILGLVIRSYVDTGLPVGSKAFVTSFGFDVSSATVRNEMAALEEMGLLTHPHPSAGRIPTEVGYRYFVEHLLGETELPLPEQYMIRHQFHQAQLELDHWVRLAVAVLAHTTRKAALATPPRARENKFKYLELIGLRDTLVLLVLVLEGGTVKQQMLTVDQPVDQETLSQLSRHLNREFGPLKLATAGWQEPLSGLGKQVEQIVRDMLAVADTSTGLPVYRDGLAHILEEPEFAEGEQARQMVQTLEGSSLVEVVMSVAQPMEIGGVQVLIGGEGRWDELAELSVVLSRYGIEGGVSGLLGVVGPVRMTYDRTIGAVRYVSRLMSGLVSEWYEADFQPDAHNLVG